MLIDRHHRLDDGRRVRLRLPHVRDAAALAGLAGVAELDARRAMRAEVAVCALAWDGAHETLVGFGRLDRDAGPEVVGTDPAVASLVRRALRERAADQRVA
jgi:hypothetical protein